MHAKNQTETGKLQRPTGRTGSAFPLSAEHTYGGVMSCV